MHRMLLSKFQEMDVKKHVCFLWNLEEFGHEKHKISFYDTLLQLHVLFCHSPHTWICTAEAHPSGWGGGVAAPNALLLHQVGFSFTYQFLGQLPKSPCHSPQCGKIHCKRQHPLCFTYSWKCWSCLQESASEASHERKSLAFSPWQGQTGTRTCFSLLSIQTTRLRAFFCTGLLQVSPCEAVRKTS